MKDGRKNLNNCEATILSRESLPKKQLEKMCANLALKLEGAADYCEKQGLTATAENFLIHACRTAIMAGEETEKINELAKKLLTINPEKLNREQEKEIEKRLTDDELGIIDGYREYERQYHELDDQNDIFNQVSDTFIGIYN